MLNIKREPMAIDWTAVLVIVFGNGLLIAIFTLVFNYYKLKSDKDFEARKTAKEYYMELYGKIAVLDELTRGYQRSIKTGTANVFTTDCKYKELPTDKILEDFKDAYVSFEAYYIEKKCKGYEIFVPEKLAKLLIEYWSSVKTFYEDTGRMKNRKAVNDTHEVAKKTTNRMEKLFGLK